MPRENSRERLIDGQRFQYDAGKVPERESDPGLEEMPTTQGGDPRPLVYFDITVNTLKLAVPDSGVVNVTTITSITL